MSVAVSLKHLPPAPARPTDTRATVRRLNQEWAHLQDHPAGWADPPATLAQILDSVPADPDTVLSGLIAACQAGHHQAGRVIVQALLPKLILLSRRFPFPGVDDLLANLWLRVARYRLDRRPTSVAANLILDAKKDTLAEDTLTVGFPMAAPEPSPSARAVLEAARTLRLATPESLTIVQSIYVEELPRSYVARLNSISVEAVRRRCCDTLRRLRENRDLLAECL